MTFSDYVAFCAIYWINHPEQRFGQVAVNVLRSLSAHSYLADKVMYDLEIDPWDDLSQVDAWFTAVGERW